MKKILLLACPLFCLLWGCGKENKPTGVDPGRVVLEWDVSQFEMSEVKRIDVTTDLGTDSFTVLDGRVSVPYPTSDIRALRVYIPDDRGSIYVHESELTIGENRIEITRDMRDYEFVHDVKTLEEAKSSRIGSFLQTKDIDLSEVANWTPLSPDDQHPFYGIYDGGGFEIRNMTVHVISNANEIAYAGFFGTNNGTLSNIRIVGGSVHGEGFILFCGGVCGSNNGVIIACSNSASVSAKATSGDLGGVCGENAASARKIISCCNTGPVSREGSSVMSGGVCGYNRGSIVSCFSTGAISDHDSKTNKLGEVCGYNQHSISYCYWGGSSNDLPAVGDNDAQAVVTGTMKFGDGSNQTGWPDASLPGWDPDYWKTLGSWNDGEPTYPEPGIY